jgi:hypothetical protein
VITITGIGDHLRPEWPITITGMRTLTGGSAHHAASGRRFDDLACEVEAANAA